MIPLNRAASLRLTTLGGLSLRSRGSAEPLLTRPRPLALLSILATAPAGGIARDKLLALLWPELGVERGRNVLNQTLFGLRRDLGTRDVVQGRTELQLNPRILDSDVSDFEIALASGDATRAVELYAGDFLDGFFLADEQGFGQWADEQRARLRRRAIGALEACATSAEQRRDLASATAWRWRIVEMDPLNSSAALSLVRVLATGGDRGGALQFARRHEALLRSEIGTGVDPAMARLIEELLSAGRMLALQGESAVKVTTDEMPPPPTRRRPTRALPIVIAVVTLALAGVATASRLAGTTGTAEVGVPTGLNPDAIAVLPFTVQGSTDAQYLRTGLVDLIGRNLDGAGAVRAIDSRVLLRAVTQDSGVDSDVDRGRRIARRLHAARFVLGDVTASGSLLRISAAVYGESPGGNPVATAVVDGRLDQVLELVDRLSARLIALQGEPARSRRFDIGGLSTRSIPALKAFFTGEAARRSGRYAQAVEAFQLAVHEDSTFALAYYGLSNAADWASRSDLVMPAAQQALRFSRRLTEHDRTLVRAYVAWREDRADEAARLYESLVHAHPDDAESWYQLGEVFYHDNSRRGRSFAESRAPFERAYALQPDNREALMHLARVIARTGSRADLVAIATRALAVASPNDAREVRAIRAFALDDTAAQEASLGELASLDGGTLATIAWRVSLYAGSLDGAERILRLGTQAGRPVSLTLAARAPLVWILVGQGRFREARAEVRALEQTSADGARDALVPLAFLMLAPDRGLSLLSVDSVGARLDSATAYMFSRRTASDSTSGYDTACILALVSARRGDSSAARRLAVRLDGARGDAAAVDRARTCAVGARARIDWMAGERKRALEAMLAHRSDRVFAMATEPLDRFFIAEMLRAVGREREAIGWYAAIAQRGMDDLAVFAPAERRLGEMAERQGDLQAAKAHYETFVRLWSRGDPELQPLVDEVRSRLASKAFAR